MQRRTCRGVNQRKGVPDHRISTQLNRTTELTYTVHSTTYSASPVDRVFDHRHANVAPLQLPVHLAYFCPHPPVPKQQTELTPSHVRGSLEFLQFILRRLISLSNFMIADGKFQKFFFLENFWKGWTVTKMIWRGALMSSNNTTDIKRN